MLLRRAAIYLLLLSVCATAWAEHDLPAEPAGDSSQRETAPRATSILNVRSPSAPSSRTVQDIQEALARTDPGMLEALKGALSEIAQGREVSGAAGEAAMEFLNRIPEEDVGVPAPQDYADEEPDTQGREELPAISSSEKLREKSESDKQKGAFAGPAVPVATIVRLEAPVFTPPPLLPGILKAAESAANPGALFKGFPYGSPGGEVDLSDEGEEKGSDGKAETKGMRRAKAGSESGMAGGGELPSGQSSYGSGLTGGGGAGPTITLLSTKTGKAGVPQGKQRLAGVVSSFLGKFQRRAITSLGDKSQGRGEIFEKLAFSSGLTPERAIATAERSPAFRHFQQKAMEVGMTPTESLGAYYAVLALAWLGSFVFIFYCVRYTCSWIRSRPRSL